MWFALGLAAVILWCIYSSGKEEREFQQKLKAWQDLDRLAKECGVVNPLPEPQRYNPGTDDPHGSPTWGM